jgi:ribosomal-protein-alanine N-acetyltransferase
MISADLPAVLDLERELFPEDAWTPRMFASELDGRSAGRYYLVAEDDGQLVGYAGLLVPQSRMTEPRNTEPRNTEPRNTEPLNTQPLNTQPLSAGPGGQADVLTMAVATAHWGQGIGSALLGALLAEAAERGCTEIFLEVRVDNPRAQQLYRRHGFTDAGLRRGYYQPSGTDALVMRRPLAARDRTGPASTGPASTGPASTGPASTGPASTASATGGIGAAPTSPERRS